MTGKSLYTFCNRSPFYPVNQTRCPFLTACTLGGLQDEIKYQKAKLRNRHLGRKLRRDYFIKKILTAD
jgi:hypothetical protein